MDTVQWHQDVVMKPMEEIVQTTCSKPGGGGGSGGLERKIIRPQKEQALNCPRCNSTNTKFCYYNNYSLSQPRYFCKTCRRYWTEGGSLRNIPVGGGSRRNKRSSSSSVSAPPLCNSNNTITSSSSISKNNNININTNNLPDLIIPSQQPTNCSRQNPKIPDGQDLNLGFSSATTTTTSTTTHHDFKTISELIQVPNFDSSNKDMISSMSCMPPCNNNSSSSTTHLSALELIGINSRGAGGLGLNSFLQMQNIPSCSSEINPVAGSSTMFSHNSGLIPLPADFKPTLNFSLDGLGISSNSGTTTTNGSGGGGGGGGYGGGHVQETSTGRLLFPFEDLKQQPSDTTSNDTDNHHHHHHHNRDHSSAAGHGYWNGVLGGNGGGGGGGSW